MYEKHRFDPRSFIELVENSIQCALGSNEYCSLKNNEAFHRTLIGRSYYSVYLRLRTILYPGRERVKHTAIINELRSQGYHKIANKLNTLKTLREDADYKLYKTINKEILERAYMLAKNLHKMIDDTPFWPSSTN